MAGGDEWIYVLSRQEAEAEAVAADPAAGDGAEESTDDGDAAKADEDGGSYGSTEVNDYLDNIEDVEEEEDDAATGGVDAVADLEALHALTIGEAAAPGAAAVSRGASGGGKAAVVENPYYGGGATGDAEAYYAAAARAAARFRAQAAWLDDYVARTSSVSGSGASARRGRLTGISDLLSPGYYYGSGYYDDDRYGTRGGYGYNRYGYYGGGGAYVYTPGYGYGDAHRYGYDYAGYAYDDPRSVLYSAMPCYPLDPFTYQVQELAARYAPPPFSRHPPRTGEPPAAPPRS